MRSREQAVHPGLASSHFWVRGQRPPRSCGHAVQQTLRRMRQVMQPSGAVPRLRFCLGLSESLVGRTLCGEISASDSSLLSCLRRVGLIVEGRREGGRAGVQSWGSDECLTMDSESSVMMSIRGAEMCGCNVPTNIQCSF
jgi:hypothetical protein